MNQKSDPVVASKILRKVAHSMRLNGGLVNIAELQELHSKKKLW